MERDKKVKDGKLSMVLNRGIGNVSLIKITDIKAVFSSVL
jgi:3-dehydroquinate synthase